MEIIMFLFTPIFFRQLRFIVFNFDMSYLKLNKINDVVNDILTINISKDILDTRMNIYIGLISLLIAIVIFIFEAINNKSGKNELSKRALFNYTKIKECLIFTIGVLFALWFVSFFKFFEVFYEIVQIVLSILVIIVFGITLNMICKLTKYLVEKNLYYQIVLDYLVKRVCKYESSNIYQEELGNELSNEFSNLIELCFIEKDNEIILKDIYEYCCKNNFTNSKEKIIAQLESNASMLEIAELKDLIRLEKKYGESCKTQNRLISIITNICINKILKYEQDVENIKYSSNLKRQMDEIADNMFLSSRYYIKDEEFLFANYLKIIKLLIINKEFECVDELINKMHIDECILLDLNETPINRIQFYFIGGVINQFVIHDCINNNVIINYIAKLRNKLEIYDFHGFLNLLNDMNNSIVFTYNNYVLSNEEYYGFGKMIDFDLSSDKTDITNAILLLNFMGEFDSTSEINANLDLGFYQSLKQSLSQINENDYNKEDFGNKKEEMIEMLDEIINTKNANTKKEIIDFVITDQMFEKIENVINNTDKEYDTRFLSFMKSNDKYKKIEGCVEYIFCAKDLIVTENIELIERYTRNCVEGINKKIENEYIEMLNKHAERKKDKMVSYINNNPDKYVVFMRSSAQYGHKYNFDESKKNLVLDNLIIPVIFSNKIKDTLLIPIDELPVMSVESYNGKKHVYELKGKDYAELYFKYKGLQDNNLNSSIKFIAFSEPLDLP